MHRVNAPGDQHHHHDSGELHDPQRLAARFRNALDVLPPEIQGDEHRDGCGGCVYGQMKGQFRVVEELVEDAYQILTCGDTADRACENVVEHQRRDGKLRESAAERFFYDAVDDAA